jgi:hypothetical protein
MEAIIFFLGTCRGKDNGGAHTTPAIRTDAILSVNSPDTTRTSKVQQGPSRRTHRQWRELADAAAREWTD